MCSYPVRIQTAEMSLRASLIQCLSPSLDSSFSHSSGPTRHHSLFVLLQKVFSTLSPPLSCTCCLLKCKLLFPWLITKDPNQPPLPPISAPCFIIHITHQFESSLTPRTPILNLMSFLCLKAFIPATLRPRVAYKIEFRCFSTPCGASHVALPFLPSFTGHDIHTSCTCSTSNYLECPPPFSVA